MGLVAALLSLQGRLTAQGTHEQIGFNVYGMDDGLSQGAVRVLLQDRQGFLWIGTQGGLNRFDGRGFRVYRHEPDDSSSLGDDYVQALLETSDGRLWVGTERGGLNLFDPLTGRAQRFPMYSLGPWQRDAGPGTSRGSDGRTIKGIERVEDGSLFLLSDLGIIRFDPDRGTAVLMGGPEESVEATALCLDRERVLVGFRDGHVRHLTTAGTWTPFARLADAVSRLRCAGGRISAATRGAILTLAEDGAVVDSVALAEPDGQPLTVLDFLDLDDGSIWIASPVGAFISDPTGEVTDVTTPGSTDPLPSPLVHALLQDRTGVLWIGTWNGLLGVHPLSRAIQRVLTSDVPTGLGGAGVIAITRVPRLGLLVGGWSAGVQMLSRDGSRELTRPGELGRWSSSSIFDITPGPAGEVWIAARDEGFVRMEPDGSARRVPVAADEQVTRGVIPAYSVLVDARGRVWAGTGTAGLLRHDPVADVFRPMTGPDWDMGSVYVWPMIEDPKGTLWVGAYNGGLNEVDPERGVLRRFESGAGGLSDTRILTLFQDSGGRIWVGTEGSGLNIVDPVTAAVTVMTTRDGLPHDNVEGIVEDDDGFIWISTNEGLARYDPRTERLRVFKEAAGLADNRFFANAVFEDVDGKLYFGGPSGITIIDPNVMSQAQNTPPPVALTDFRIQGRDAPLARALEADGLDLAPDENFFAFEFAALDFTDPSQNRYRYRLSGLDADWVDAGGTPVANYTSVPPGRYTFEVAARNSEGVWNERGLAIPVHVRAPFYATLWFQLGSAALLLSAILAIYGNQVAQERERQAIRLAEEQKRQELRLGIAGGLHDEVSANLSAIGQMADLAARLSTPAALREDLMGRIARLARDSSDQVRETVWVVNTRYDTLADLVDHMADTADALLIGEVEYEFVRPTHVPDRPLDMQLRQDVFYIYKEALHNAAKHAPGSHVRIEVSLQGNRLLIRVEDDGMGYDRDKVRAGSGLSLMAQRADRIGAEIRMASAPGRGTAVMLYVEMEPAT